MNNLWEQLSKEVPKFFNKIIEQYNFKVVIINELKTALVKPEFALLITVDRFNADAEYIMRLQTGQLVKLCCSNFFTTRYDDGDRKNIVHGETAKELITNDLIIMSQGIESKWGSVLKGDRAWINEFKKSEWYNTENLREEEIKILEDIIV